MAIEKLVEPVLRDFEYEIGDVVCLNCGGPAMTVVEVEAGMLECVWFDGHDRLHHASLPVAAVMWAMPDDLEEPAPKPVDRRVRYWGILRPETEAALRKRDDYMSTRD